MNIGSGTVWEGASGVAVNSGQVLFPLMTLVYGEDHPLQDGWTTYCIAESVQSFVLVKELQ